MKFCEKCGKELFDEAVICPGCGCPAQATECTIPKKPREKMKKKTKILIIVSAIVAFLILVAVILFAPRNLKLNNFTQKPNQVQALVTFGLPTNTEGDEWIYRDIKIHGIEVDMLTIDFKDDVYQILDIEGSYELYDMIDRKCDYKKDLAGIYDIYSYKDAIITTDGWWFEIEVD